SRRGFRRARADDKRAAPRVHGVRKAPLRQRLLFVVQIATRDRPRRNEGRPAKEEAAEADDVVDDDHDDYDDANDSAVAIDSASAAGIRTGRSVFASTHACEVHPSAITSPPRVTT